MTNLASAGIGSGLDVNGIITSLMATENQPLTVLAKKEAAFQAKLSAYGSLKGVVSSFQSAVAGLNTQSKFQAYSATSSDSTVLSASTSSISATGSTSITISQLAQAQTILTAAKTSTTAPIAAANSSTVLTFQFGSISGGSLTSGTYSGSTFTQDAAQSSGTVTITNSNNSLQGIRDSINAANIGVTASIINNGDPTTPYSLVLTSKSSGLASSMRISTGVGADAAITSLLAYNPAGTQNLTQSAVAQNATLTSNGVSITSSSNSVTGAFPGTTLNLIKVGTANLNVTRDTTAIAASVQAFVKAYNDTTNTLKSFTIYDLATKKAGPLLGDSSALLIQSRIRNTISSGLTGLGSNSLTSLSQIGVSFQKDGTLTFDSNKLQTALTNNFNEVPAIFTAAGKPSDSLISYISSTAGGSSTSVSRGAVLGSSKSTQSVQTGQSAANLTITSSNNNFNISVNGGTVVPVSLTAATYTAAELASHVQTKINEALTSQGSSVSVSASSGIISITSNTFGTSSGVSLTAGTNAGNTDLFGGVPTSSSLATITTGVNDTMALTVDGINATITLSAGSYTATALAGLIQSTVNSYSGFSTLGKSVTVSQSSDVLTITSNSYGSTSSVSIANGTAKTNLLGANPTTTSTAGQLNGTQPGSYAVTVTTLPTQGKAVGSVTASTTIADGATLAVTLGDTSATVALTAGSYTASTLAAHIQSAINGNSTLIAAGKTVNVSQSTGVLTITSANYGSTSTVNLTGGTAKTDLFGTTTTATSGVDASGTINGVAAIGSGQFLTGATGNASEGLKIQVVGGLTGSRGTVDYSQGYAYKLNKLMDSFLNTTGSIASRTDGINKSIADISLQRTAMTRRLATTEALYRKQFTSLDTLVASLNSTGTSLTSMLKGLPSSSYTQSSTN